MLRLAGVTLLWTDFRLDTLHHHTQWKAFFPLLSMFYLGLGGVVGVWEDLPTIDIVQRSAFCYPNYGAHLFTRPDHRRLPRFRFCHSIQ